MEDLLVEKEELQQISRMTVILFICLMEITYRTAIYPHLKPFSNRTVKRPHFRSVHRPTPFQQILLAENRHEASDYRTLEGKMSGSFVNTKIRWDQGMHIYVTRSAMMLHTIAEASFSHGS